MFCSYLAQNSVDVSTQWIIRRDNSRRVTGGPEGTCVTGDLKALENDPI